MDTQMHKKRYKVTKQNEKSHIKEEEVRTATGFSLETPPPPHTKTNEKPHVIKAFRGGDSAGLFWTLKILYLHSEIKTSSDKEKPK